MTGRVLVVGAAVRRGAAVANAVADRDVVTHTRASLDVTDSRAVSMTVADTAPELLINCTAFNDVDGAETRPTDALAVNAFAVRSLARAAEACGATFVHF